MTPAELGELRFLYVATGDTDTAIARWTEDLGGRLRWRFRRFGADVAGIDVHDGTGPLVILADHRPNGTVLPIFAVADVDAAVDHLRGAGWTVDGPMGTPEGDAAVLTSPDGSELAVLQVDRPDALDGAFADHADEHRVP